MTGPYQEAVERFPRLRQSTLASFDRCALSTSFEQSYEQGWSSFPQARGTMFHRVAAEMLKTMFRLEDNTLPVSEAIAILDEQIRQDDVDKTCPKCGADAAWDAGEKKVVCANGHRTESDFVNLPMSELKDLRWTVAKFAKENAFDIANLVDVEQRIDATVRYPDGQGGGVDRVLTGQLDALFIVGDQADHAIVLDWKDTWALPAPTEVGFDGYFQQRFYAWLVFRNYPTVQRVTLREVYVRYSEHREADVWRGDIEDVEADLSALAERFDAAFTLRRFPPTPGKHCGFCPLPERCPIFPAVRGEGAVTDAETAERFARELTVAKAAVKSRDAGLKAWVERNGPVPISDHKGKRQIGFRPAKRVARPDRAAVEQALAEAGGANVDVGALFKESTVTRFEAHTPADPPPPDATDERLERALRESLEGRA